MIEKSEILTIARNLILRPDTVEKDYVLGWMLHGINNHQLTKTWVFKGGTSIKKCYFETFRFSEDLDFTLENNNHIERKFLLKAFSEIAEFLSEAVGIEFYPEKRQGTDHV